ncbi:MAG: xanthine dehydrogenase family protein subunit M [Rhodospirillaceae bacterium]|mgnify:CR=1 FL=1|jgi:CO/xanthine dehydrogenase FAD-binding subunit|nr:xanthine dehydrogenase family protein subunit M [Rhodospirillaceae bacterium]MBT3926585.1 xanthine dehydrogenase family protein subunit M [Rhodospirillaceae bacterium]MBT5779487.1 xanthine dehydrogenase family protein subunit M [Rhodospirillaceae bacterium]
MAEYLLPRTLGEAGELMMAHGRSLAIIAGGTSAMRCGTCRGKRGRGIACIECAGPRLVSVPNSAFVMDIQHLGLDQIEADNGLLRLGAGVSMRDLAASDLPETLRQAARRVGGPALRNLATVGGNIFARQPYGTVAAVLLAMDAVLVFAAPDGPQRIDLAEFYAAGGSAPGLLTHIECPHPEGKLLFLKCARQRFGGPTVISVALRIELADDGTVSAVRIALGGAGEHPLRAVAAEQLLSGKPLAAAAIDAAAAAAQENCAPADDPVASAWYRRRMVGVYVGRALSQAAGIDVEGAPA